MLVRLIAPPLNPPWSNASKVLAARLAAGLTHTRAIVPCRGKPAPGAEREHLIWDPLFLGPLADKSPLQKLQAAARIWMRGDEGVDLYHFLLHPSPGAASFGRALRRRTDRPCIQTVMNGLEEGNPQGLRGLFFADRVVVFTERTERRLLDAGVAGVRRIPPGAPPAPPRGIVLPEVEALRRPRFLFPLESTAERGVDIVTAAAREVWGSGDSPGSIVLACKVYDAAEEERNRRVAEELRGGGLGPDRARVLGMVADVRALLATCDAVVYPVRSMKGKMELPLVLLEALAAGLPILAPPLEALPELVLGGAGEVVGPDAGAWAAALRRWSEAPRREAAGAASLRVWRERHDERVFVESVEALYREVVA